MASPIAAMLKPILEQATPDGQGTAFGPPSATPGAAATSAAAASASTPPKSLHIPPSEFSVINTPLDIDKVMDKVLQFNQTSGHKFQITDDHLTRLRLLNEPGVKLDHEVIALSWRSA